MQRAATSCLPLAPRRIDLDSPLWCVAKEGVERRARGCAQHVAIATHGSSILAGITQSSVDVLVSTAKFAGHGI